MTCGIERNATVCAESAPELTRRRKLAYTTICILAALLLAEAGVRLRARLRYGTTSPSAQNAAYMYDETLKLLVPRPGAELHGSQINVTINSLGFRGQEFSKEKPPNTVRIACLGASTTYCPEVSSNAAAWPAQLQALLQTRFPNTRIEVINGGIQSLVIRDSIKNLRYRLLPLQPDLVIFYEAHNDLAVDTRELAKSRGLIDDNSGRQSAVARYLSQKSLLFYLVDRNIAVLSGKRASTIGKLTEVPRDLPNEFVAHLEEMHDILADRGIPLVLSRFLVRFRQEQPRETQLANAEIAFAYMPWMTIDSLLDSFDLYNEATARYAQSRNIPYVEDESVAGDGSNYVDHVHFSDAGCRAMALRFARFFDDHSILDPIVARAAASVASVRGKDGT